MKNNMSIQKTLIIWLFAICTPAILNANVASFNSSDVCFGTANVFTSTSSSSSGTIVSYEWDFDNDGIYDATGQQVTFTFPGPGVYSVNHRITTSDNFVATTLNQITVFPNPTASFTHTGVCVGDTVNFDATASIATGFIASYEWDFNGSGNFQGGTGDNIDHFFPGTGYFNVGLRVTSDNNCVFEIQDIVTLTNKPQAAFTADNACQGNATEFTNASFVSTGNLTHLWHFGNGDTSLDANPSLTYAQSGTYQVTLTTSTPSGCNDVQVRDVHVYPNPTAGLSASDVCLGNDVVFQNTSSTNGGILGKYEWTFGDGNTAINKTTTLSYNYPEVGTYQVDLVVENANGCSDQTSISVQVNSNPIYPIEYVGAEAVCRGNSVDLELNSDSLTTVIWSTSENTKRISVTESGFVQVLLISPENCQYRDTAEVVIYEASDLELEEEITINNGDVATLSVSGSSTYLWTGEAILSGANTANPIVSPSSTTTYLVESENEFGCASQAEIKVTVIDNYFLKPMNLFTPDGNGQNDFWVIENIDRYPQCEVSVFDQWGREIFSKSSYSNDWDGTRSGQQMPEGTYYYTITCPDFTENYNGFITLLRIN